MTVDALGLTTLSGIEKFHQLRRLSAYGNTLTDLAPLAELFSVEELQLGYNNLYDLSALTGHTALRRLILDHNALRDITALSGCTALEELDLSYNDLNSPCGAPLAHAASHAEHHRKSGSPLIWCARCRRLSPPARSSRTSISPMPEPTPEPPAETPQP